MVICLDDGWYISVMEVNSWKENYSKNPVFTEIYISPLLGYVSDNAAVKTSKPQYCWLQLIVDNLKPCPCVLTSFSLFSYTFTFLILKDLVLKGSLSGNRNNQLDWLIRTLEANSSNWRIVIGYQQLKKPYSVFLNGNSVFSRELANGFLLHRVSSVQIVTYYINLVGEVAYKTVLQQKGREAM
ncbi:uncharacterized protein LOC133317760 [Gastrolobium bilobum]|uniref:uncharacterized protein LOC133317760 n=1 Tax=Gastrolobium bilobum TaxID=150636 RepID=UPI002AB02231|nr:uncharacterized protein LOC133317760 [Gastrolobium bilobum]